MASDAIYLTPAELCERLRNRVAMKTLATWRRTGRGPRHIKLASGRRGAVLYPLSAVEEWEQRLDEESRKR